MYSNKFPGRDGSGQDQTTEGPVSIVPAGRNVVDLEKGTEDEIKGEEVSVIKRDDIQVVINGTEPHN